MRTVTRLSLSVALVASLVAPSTVLADASPPTVVAPTHRLVVGHSLSTTQIPARISWSASDPDGIKSFRVHMSTDSGTWSGVTLPTATTTSITRWLTPGHYYQFRVSATDKANNTSAWTSGPKFYAFVYDQTSSSITWSSGWFTRSMSGAWRGSVRTRCYGNGTNCSPTAPGSWSKVTFYGRTIGYVAPRYPFCWFADIYVDGVWRAKVDLYWGSNQYRRINYVASWSTPGTHTLMVKYSSNPSPYKPNLDVDGFAILR